MGASVYAPLNPGIKQTRLLTLKPSAELGAKIIGIVEDVNLDDRPNYEALSWCWETPPYHGSMILNGLTFNIPENLEEALTQFRLPEQSRTLWVDAICINQHDNIEREAQIMLMKDIYTTATRTLVWLGPTEPGMDGTVPEYLRRLGRDVSLGQIVLEQLGVWDPREPHSDDEVNSLLDTIEISTTNFRKATDVLTQLSRFFERHWWQRCWVLQEVALASDAQFLWKDECLSFAQLTSAHDNLRAEFRDKQTYLAHIFGYDTIQDFLVLMEKSLNTTRHLKAISDLNRFTDRQTPQRDMCFQMVEILAKARNRSASDPRDKVHGLLGLVHVDLTRHFPPSYSETVQEVYRNAAYKLLALSKSFMLFSCIYEVLEFHPGWCPDWTREIYQIQNFHLRAQQESLFQACYETPWHVPRLLNNNALEVKGFRLDVICRIWWPNYDLTDAASLYMYLKGAVRRLNNGLWGPDENRYDTSVSPDWIQTAKYITGIALLDALSRTALNDCEPMQKDGQVQRLRPNNSKKFLQWLSTDHDEEYIYRVEPNKRFEEMAFEGTDDRSMCEFARSVIAGKQLFATKLGYIGLMALHLDQPPAPIVNEVWILAGGSQPVILRSDPKNEGCYFVCSEAYVHGVMDGEAARGTVPVLPRDSDTGTIESDLRHDRKNWPKPEFKTIRLL